MRLHADGHPADHELLLAGDRELPAARQASVDAHVSACADCAARLRRMDVTLSCVQDVYHEAFDRGAASSADARARLERSLTALGGWERAWPTRLRRAVVTSPAWAVVGVAAMTLLLATWLARPDGIIGGSRVTAGERPSVTLTPGAVAPLSANQLCAGERPSRRVAFSTRQAVLASYRMAHIDPDAYELDALITPELGGTTDAANLWPQLYSSPVWNARVKDELELLLPTLVCRGEVDLAQAQREIATDWIAAYQHYFATDAPLQTHRGPALEEDDELEFEPPPTITRALLTGFKAKGWQSGLDESVRMRAPVDRISMR